VLLDSVTVFRHASRVARGRMCGCRGNFQLSSLAMVEVAIAKQNGAQIKHGLEL
jgi:hypothetical protein